MTAFATVPAAVEAMRTGAADYLAKPFALDELTAVLERAWNKRWNGAPSKPPAAAVGGNSAFWAGAWAT